MEVTCQNHGSLAFPSGDCPFYKEFSYYLLHGFGFYILINYNFIFIVNLTAA